MLLLYTLECLYSLTSMGEKPCNMMCEIHGIVDTIVSLITVEAQSYGPDACILMRVVETVPGRAFQQNQQAQQQALQTHHQVHQVRQNMPSPAMPQQVEQQRVVQQTPKIVMMPSDSPKLDPQQSLVNKHSQQQALQVSKVIPGIYKSCGILINFGLNY